MISKLVEYLFTVTNMCKQEMSMDAIAFIIYFKQDISQMNLICDFPNHRLSLVLHLLNVDPKDNWTDSQVRLLLTLRRAAFPK